jgi:hypothetical protein
MGIGALTRAREAIEKGNRLGHFRRQKGMIPIV